MNFIKKWQKRIQRKKKGRKLYLSIKRNSGKLVSAAELVHKAVIK